MSSAKIAGLSPLEDRQVARLRGLRPDLRPGLPGRSAQGPGVLVSEDRPVRLVVDQDEVRPPAQRHGEGRSHDHLHRHAQSCRTTRRAGRGGFPTSPSPSPAFGHASHPATRHPGGKLKGTAEFIAFRKLTRDSLSVGVAKRRQFRRPASSGRSEGARAIPPPWHRGAWRWLEMLVGRGGPSRPGADRR